MIINTHIGVGGRLGNQLFQLAAMKSLALKNNSEAFLPDDIDTRVWDGQQCLLRHFNLNLKKLPLDEYNSTNIPVYRQKVDKTIDLEFFDISATKLNLLGHFESEQYFYPYAAQIKDMFEIENKIQEFAEGYIQSLKEDSKDIEIVGIHFRRGDYIEPKENPDPFFYFANIAIDTFFSDKPYIFLIFSGGNKANSKEDILYCKERLKDLQNAVFCEVNDTMRELSIMTKCDHNILTTKSTLGWWGAYLNKNKEKKVVVPRNPIGPGYNPDILWPSEFLQI